METSMEDFARSDVDAEMTILTSDDVTGQNTDHADEVENLRKSLREAVHDDSIQPKMQCLMMDSSFSMVTMQSENSGIAWETTPSPCATPWTPEAGSIDAGSPALVQAATAGSRPAGKIIFVMDEEMISRQRKTKENINSQKSKTEKTEVLDDGFEMILGRPELVEVSQPNVKVEGETDQEEATDPLVDKEQCLFSIVSEGSEILNIVVPPKLATVDEEESNELVDNLSYLEESPVPKGSEETQDSEPLNSEVETGMPPSPRGVMDPPGAPVARPASRIPARNLDYFDAFSLIDAQAPGSPAVVAHQQEEPQAEPTTESQVIEKPVRLEDHAISKRVDMDQSDTISLEELTSELLDEVFYGSSDSYPVKSLDSADEGEAERGAFRLPSKPSGSTLFGSQEDILTPVFLPEGPPKIIDLILLEEPKAMAFLYTDLYEEALGSRKKEEDTESMTSEKSFHSRNSDREARGYLEKFVLIDETPAVEVEQQDMEACPEEEEQRTLPQELLDFEDLMALSEKEMQHSEEVTDFFRSSGNSSPCDIEPFPRSLEGEETATTKREVKTQKSVSIAVEQVPETTGDQFDSSGFEFTSDELDWEITDDDPTAMHAGGQKDEDVCKQDLETNKPVAPPRKKIASSTKASLDLTPLTPVYVTAQEKEEAVGKEQRVEEKETASPVETADEGDGDGEEVVQAASGVSEATLVEVNTESVESEIVKDNDATPAQENEAKTDGGQSDTITATEQIGLKETDVKSDVKTDIIPESQDSSSAEPAKTKGQCIIL
ncbi:cardiomyopathy-associated protein 5 [Nothobranchius furzeri]|uniref:Cardiomyopathy-associated protein 5-like n=1 Tax=Nothobranchius furzeri TaxID=105023 RepID=A0A9D2YCV7_NOTFU|nr:cardiomyopathy-associated protein 5-like [Nothobranchius furzeri]